MRRLAMLLDNDREELAETMTMEMGKTLSSARLEVEKCASVCRYYAEHAETALRDEVIPSNATVSYVRYQPLGPVLAIMPYEDEQDAVRIANDSDYGLAGGVYSASGERATALARSVNRSTIFPLPSSPHCKPIAMTNLPMR